MKKADKKTSLTVTISSEAPTRSKAEAPKPTEEEKRKVGRRPFTYKIIKHIATLTEGKSITKEVNIVQYADDPPRLDVRCWKRKDGAVTLLKGVSFTDEEAAALEKAVHQYNQERAGQEKASKANSA